MIPSTSDRCDFCPGTVRDIEAEHEPVRVAGRVVIINGGIIGKCDRCGHRYFPINMLRDAEKLALHPELAARVESVPVSGV